MSVTSNAGLQESHTKRHQLGRFLAKFAPWLALLGLFYASWLAYVLGSGSWDTVRAHWPIALAMALGSYVAGSTPMGGGTVGFPVLVLGFDFPATLGRDFSFAIQSVGMVSASVFILSRRQPLEWPMLRTAIVGSVLGTPLGLIYFAPHLSEISVKVVFAVLWAGFGILHLVKAPEISQFAGVRLTAPGFDRAGGFLVGLLGGVFVCSITGVGVDMLIYMVLVLLRRADLKVAIPTSVVLMAASSVVGIATQNVRGAVQDGVFEHWLAAAPVVAVGAPLGALIVEKIGRVPTLLFVSILCVLQFAWTMYHEAEVLGSLGVLASLLGVGAFTTMLGWMYRVGKTIR